MQGMFRANGGCGYVKKPEILMQKLQCDNEFDPKMMMPVKKTLKVSIVTIIYHLILQGQLIYFVTSSCYVVISNNR
jgi:hypothetical protein